MRRRRRVDDLAVVFVGLPPDAVEGRRCLLELALHLPVEREGEVGDVELGEAQRLRRLAFLEVTAAPEDRLGRVVDTAGDFRRELLRCFSAARVGFG